jgi:hypothetical protein
LFCPLTSPFPFAWFKTALCLSRRVSHLAAFKKTVLRSPSLNFANYWQRLFAGFWHSENNQPREHSLASFLPDRWQAQEAFLQDQGRI